MNPPAAARGCVVRIASALLALAVPAVLGLRHGDEYVFISQPTQAKVMYVVIDAFTLTGRGPPKPLVTKGLGEPYGLAFDKENTRLFVADVGLGKVLMYKVKGGDEDGVLATDGQSYVAIGGVKPRWVSVDDAGNVYCTDEQQNLVVKVTKAQLEASKHSPTTVYSATSVAGVSAPSGIAASGTYVFWGNKKETETKGSVVRGLEVPVASDPSSIRVLANDVEKVYGVCACRNNVYYTAETNKLYGVTIHNQDPSGTASSAGVVSGSFIKPRGCIWDGDGSIYVADRGGAIYAFPAGMHHIEQTTMSKVIDVTDPFGVAVYRPTVRGGLQGGSWFGRSFLGKTILSQFFGVK